MSAFVFFFRKRPLKMAIAVTLFFGAPGIVTYNYFTTDRVKIEEAKPITAGPITLMPQALAGEQGPPIVWNGNTYGFEDTLFVAKVLQGTSIILVYDKTSKRVWKADFTTNFKKAK